ncbi:hypothetical protein Ndes2526B_g08196 [Nannochloris sp. 'desiccata']
MPRNHLLPIEVPQPASNTKRKERSPTGDQETINEAELTSRARRYLARKRAIKTELKKATDQELSGREEHASFEAEGAAAPAPELGPPLSFFGGSLGSLAHRIRRLFLKGLHTLKCPRRSAAAPAVPTPAAAPAAPQAPAPRPTAVTAPQAQPADPAHVLPANTPSFPPLLQHQQQQKSPLKMILPASPRASSPRIQAARNAPAVTRAACLIAAPKLGTHLSFFGDSLDSLAQRIRRLFLKGLHTLKYPRRSVAAPAVPTPAVAPAPQAPGAPQAQTQAAPSSPSHSPTSRSRSPPLQKNPMEVSNLVTELRGDLLLQGELAEQGRCG